MEQQDLGHPPPDPSEPLSERVITDVSPATPVWPERMYALFEILLCSGIATSLGVQLIFFRLGFSERAILSSSNLTTALVLLESALLLGLILLLQRLRAESIWELGFAARSYGREVRIGLAIVPLLFVTNFLVAQLFRAFLPQWVSNENPLLNLVKTPYDLVLFLFVSLLVGGVKEEIQRAFILQRFRKYLFGATAGLIFWSIFFGAGHYLQGFDSAFGAAVYGLIFGAVYLWRNCLVAPMVAHAVYDMSVVTGFWFMGEKS